MKANQRKVLKLLTLLLKNSAPPQPVLPSITELFQLPIKDEVTDANKPLLRGRKEK